MSNRIRDNIKFEGSLDYNAPFRYAVFANILCDDEEKIIGGQRVANFKKKKFAKKCKDQVNEINPLYETHIYKHPRLRIFTRRLIYKIKKRFF